MTETDPLTGLPTRAEFTDSITSSIQENGDSNARTPVSVAFFDVDVFLHVNEEYGKDTGDTVLIELSKLFTGSLNDGAQTFRIGGDEFAVIMPETEKETAFLRLEAVRSAFSGLESLRKISPPPTISIGLATMRPDSRSQPSTLMYAADQNLYRAKETGRNRIVATVLGETSTAAT